MNSEPQAKNAQNAAIILTTLLSNSERGEVGRRIEFALLYFLAALPLHSQLPTFGSLELLAICTFIMQDRVY
jgi:hypothetical protein